MSRESNGSVWGARDSKVLKEGVFLAEATPDETERVNQLVSRLMASIDEAASGTFEIKILDDLPHEAGQGACIALIPGRPYGWGDGRVFTKLFLIDCGDENYEARFQLVEPVLKRMPEVQSVSRETSPNSMLKDMLYVQILA